MPAGRQPDFQNVMRDIAPAYLERKRSELVLYREYLSSGDLNSIRLLSHKMKGTGTGFGFPRLTQLGAAIETAATNGRSGELAARVEELAAWFAQMERT